MATPKPTYLPMPTAGSFMHRSAPSKTVCGAGALAQLHTELRLLGIERPVLVCGRRTAQSAFGTLARQAVAGLACAEFTETPAHSSVQAVATVVELARQHGADAFIAVGGGSASDTAKAASLWLAEGGELAAHASRFTAPSTLFIPELRASKLPIVALPGTASGAEVTPSLGVRTDGGEKLLFWDLQLAARLIVIDAQASASVPAAALLASGMNGLAHCIEGLYSKTRTPVSTALALHGIGLFAQALPRVANAPESVQARQQLLIAGHLGGLVLMNARTCVHHAICHALGAVAGVSHGEANAVILPHAMSFNAPAAADALADVAHAWRSPTGLDTPAAASAEAGAEAAVSLVRALQQRIGVPTRLRDIGVSRALLEPIAQKVMTERGVYFNPRAVRRATEIAALLEAAW